MGELPLVSVIMACRNEEQFIDISLDSILASDYPKDKFEILVVDGMSNDRTRSSVQGYVDSYPNIRLFDNPRLIAPVAQNIGISHANGSIIMIMDAHNTYAPDYISKCVERMYEYDVDCVGGVWEILPRESTFVAKAIVCAMGHPFGVGNGSYRTGKTSGPIFTDAAAFGCYRTEVFEQIGPFDEKLSRSYDFDFNSRLSKTGRRILLVPDAVVYHYARSTLGAFSKHNFINGTWITYPLIFGKRLFSIRHLVPLAFVLGLLASAALALVWQPGSWLLAAVVGAYLLANVAVSAQAAVSRRDIRYLPVLVVILASGHLNYGFGSLWGLLKVMAHKISRLFKRSNVSRPG